MIRWNTRTTEPRCIACRFDCRICKWWLRQRRVSRGGAGTTVVLDLDDPATVDALFAPGPLADAMSTGDELADELDFGDELDLGDERHDAMRDDPELYLDERGVE